MAQQTINIGSAPDDGTGDTLRVGGDKINDNFTELYADYLPKAGGTLTGDLIVPDEAYDATAWNGSLEVPTKNAVRDKIESLGASGLTVEDEGSSEGTGITTLNFTGSGASVTVVGSEAEIIIPGGISTFALGDATDVDTTGQTTGDVLTYDGADWVPQAPSGWQLAGTGQTATGVYDFAVDGAKANVDFTGLAGYADVMLVMRAVTQSVSGVVAWRVSVDNGSSFYSASGDYVFLSTAGVETNSAAMGTFHLTNATAARSGVCMLHGANVNGALKAGVNITEGGSHRLFVASTSPVNAIRVYSTGAGNITGGKIYCLVR